MIGNSGIEDIAAIEKASSSTGVDFAYLVHQAKAESNFNPSVKAKTSSATGLFQFIKSTWLDVVEKHGAKHGISADQSRSKLLNLRKNPEVASVMAAEFAKDNQSVLEARWGGEVGQTELYFAHFLGAGGASSFLNAHDQNPSQRAAVLFPEAAKANRGVFYDTAGGRAKSLSEVYQHFDKKFQEAPAAPVVPQIEAEIAVAAIQQSPTKPQSVVFIDGQRETITWNQFEPVRNPIAPRHYIANPLDLLILAQTEAYERTSYNA